MKRILTILLLFVSILSGGQNDLCQKSTEGTDFWFGFMESRNYHSAHFLEITVTARETTSFNITIGNQEVPFGSTYTVTGNSSMRVEIPWSLVEAIGSEEIQDKGIHLTSEKPVNVYALNYDNNSADVAVIYPTESLGNEYFAMCYDVHIHEGNNGQYGNGRNSQFLVVASEDSTNVTILPSVVTDKLVDAGDTINIILNKGEVYQIQSMNRKNLSGQGDLTGSYIKTDKPVALYSGSLATTVPASSGTSAWDHLYEQIPPIHSWGREFYAAPLRTREYDLYRVMAAEDNTVIQITDQSDIILNRGEHYEFTLRYTEPSRIFSDKAILVAQYSQSRSVDNNFTGGNGDPFMIILSSTTQSKNDVTFEAYNSERIKGYYVNIITLKEEVTNIRFDGQSIAQEFRDFPDGKYAYAQKTIGMGTHRIVNINEDRGFLAYVYGYGGVESYGYGVGFNLDLVLDIGESIDFNGDTLLLCQGDSRILDAGPYFDTYHWSTGDSTQKLTISEGGKYKIRTTTIDGCELEDSIYVYVSAPSVTLNTQYNEACSPHSELLTADTVFEEYNWYNLNNEFLSRDPTYLAEQSDTYILEVKDKYRCLARDSMTLVVFPTPKAQIEGNSLICGTMETDLEVLISEASEFLWNYPGSFSWSANSPQISFSNLDHEGVQIKADSWGSYEIYYELKTLNDCIGWDTFQVRFHPTPNSDFVFEDGSKCEGYSKTLQFTGSATDSAEFFWDLDGCQFVDTLDRRKYSITVGAFLDKPPYIQLFIDDNGCLSDTTVKPLGAKPNFTMDADVLRGCDQLTVNFTSELLTNDQVNFQWKFGDGQIVESQNAQKHFIDTGFYAVTLTITNPVTQCTNGFTLDSMIKVYPTPTADITVDEELCHDDTIRLIYTNKIDSSKCYWTIDGGKLIGSGNDTVHALLERDTVNALLYVDEYGCISEEVSVHLKRIPNFDFESSFLEGCQPLQTELRAFSQDEQLTYYWLTDSIDIQGSSHLFTISDSGRFTPGLIAHSGITGCIDTLIKRDWIWVHPKPIAAFEPDYPVALLEHSEITFTNQSEYSTIYSWDFGDFTQSQEENPVHTFNALGDYPVRLIAETKYGCLDTTTFSIKILPFSVHTPNAFRPNSEIEENRTFMPVGVGADMSRFKLIIYDRWGQIVYETNSPDSPWDGTSQNGSNAPMGNYVWISDYYDIQGYRHQQKGQVLLIR